MSKQIIFLPLGNMVLPGISGFDISQTIHTNYKEEKVSPIDAFLKKGLELNRLLTTTTPPVILSNLIILGYVSAVESYFREINRRLILIDEVANENCEEKKISFGTVMAQIGNVEILPEALFEEISFASKKNIISALNTFLGIVVNESLNPDLNLTLNQFSEVCELRHCIAHRFGKFGSRNAISLGMKKHKVNIEKPIQCNYNSLQEIITICQNTVRIVNNFLFDKILMRCLLDQKRKVNPRITWTWDYSIDKILFQKYYYTFNSKLEVASLNNSPKKMYDKYHNYFKTIS